jgi:heterodisulfide reductase subunit B
LAHRLAARNLLLAHGELLAACSACYSRLKLTQKALENEPDLRADLEGIFNRELDPKLEVRSILEVLRDNLDEIRSQAEGLELKVACYYGCLLTHNPRIEPFDSVEDPTSMELLVEAIGAEPIPWSSKTDCCGAGFSLTQEEIFLRLSTKILDTAKLFGAEAIVVACPFCHYNLDYAQWKLKAERVIPVLYITQLLGLALGVREGLMLNANLAKFELERVVHG